MSHAKAVLSLALLVVLSSACAQTPTQKWEYARLAISAQPLLETAEGTLQAERGNWTSFVNELIRRYGRPDRISLEDPGEIEFLTILGAGGWEAYAVWPGSGGVSRMHFLKRLIR